MSNRATGTTALLLNVAHALDHMLGIFAAHLDATLYLAGLGVDQQHEVVLFNRSGEPFAIRRKVDRLGRISEWRASDHRSAAGIDR